jgi:uncharacterized membrane protein YesL
MTHMTLADRITPVYEAIVPFFTLNVLWVALSLPLITLIPATAALLYAMNRHAHGRTAGWTTFFEGFRRWFWRSYLWGGLNVIVVVVLGSNIAFYTQLDTAWAPLATALAAAVLLLWLILQVVTFPLMLQQDQPRLRLALRNSVVMLGRRPLPLLGYAALIGLIALGSTFVFPLAWLVISVSLIAYLMNRATIGVLRKLLPADPGADSR